MELSDVEPEIVEFERGWRKYPGAKDTAIAGDLADFRARFLDRGRGGDATDEMAARDLGPG